MTWKCAQLIVIAYVGWVALDMGGTLGASIFFGVVIAYLFTALVSRTRDLANQIKPVGFTGAHDQSAGRPGHRSLTKSPGDQT